MISMALRSSGVTFSGVSKGPGLTESNEGTVCPMYAYSDMMTLTESCMRSTRAERGAEIVDISVKPFVAVREVGSMK